MSTRPGWYPDPSDRFAKRWHDGDDWTGSVLDEAGEHRYDELPPATSSAPAAPPDSGARSGPVTTASLGLTPAPEAPPLISPTSLAAYALVVLGTVGIALSMFVLDWHVDGSESAGFRDFDERTPDSSASVLDKLTFWNFKWIGFVVAGVALHSVFMFVVVRGASHRLGHVIAALEVAAGAILSTFVVVRLFRPDGFDPEIGAWLLPAGYVVLLAAVVVSSRDERA